MPQLEVEDYQAIDINRANVIQASDYNDYVELKIDVLSGNTMRFIIWSDLIAPLLDIIEAKI